MGGQIIFLHNGTNHLNTQPYHLTHWMWCPTQGPHTRPFLQYRRVLQITNLCPRPTTTIPHTFTPNYAYILHHRDTYNTLIGVIIHIVSYCDNTTRLHSRPLRQPTHSINIIQHRPRRRLSLITKLGNKHTKCSDAIINHPPDKTTQPPPVQSRTTITTYCTPILSTLTYKLSIIQSFTTTPLPPVNQMTNLKPRKR